jgi:hypothetical protein
MFAWYLHYTALRVIYSVSQRAYDTCIYDYKYLVQLSMHVIKKLINWSRCFQAFKYALHAIEWSRVLPKVSCTQKGGRVNLS